MKNSASFNEMISSFDHTDSIAILIEDESYNLASYKPGLGDIMNAPHDWDGFDEIRDDNQDDFTKFSQNYVEQTDKFITIGVTLTLLILVILLLL